jgi:hypothetical protein
MISCEVSTQIVFRENIFSLHHCRPQLTLCMFNRENGVSFKYLLPAHPPPQKKKPNIVSTVENTKTNLVFDYDRDKEPGG